MDLHFPDLLGYTRHSHQTLANINYLYQGLHHRHYIRINSLHTIHLGHLILEVLEALTRITINLMGRATKGTGMNVGMDLHHEEGEGEPNRVVGEEEAVDEIGIEEGTGTGEIDKGILVGRREAGEEVVLGGVNALGHEKNSQMSVWL